MKKRKNSHEPRNQNPILRKSNLDCGFVDRKSRFPKDNTVPETIIVTRDMDTKPKFSAVNGLKVTIEVKRIYDTGLIQVIPGLGDIAPTPSMSLFASRPPNQDKAG